MQAQRQTGESMEEGIFPLRRELTSKARQNLRRIAEAREEYAEDAQEALDYATRARREYRLNYKRKHPELQEGDKARKTDQSQTRTINNPPPEQQRTIRGTYTLRHDLFQEDRQRFKRLWEEKGDCEANEVLDNARNRGNLVAKERCEKKKLARSTPPGPHQGGSSVFDSHEPWKISNLSQDMAGMAMDTTSMANSTPKQPELQARKSAISIQPWAPGTWALGREPSPESFGDPGSSSKEYAERCAERRRTGATSVLEAQNLIRAHVDRLATQQYGGFGTGLGERVSDPAVSPFPNEATQPATGSGDAGAWAAPQPQRPQNAAVLLQEESPKYRSAVPANARDENAPPPGSSALHGQQVGPYQGRTTVPPTGPAGDFTPSQSTSLTPAQWPPQAPNVDRSSQNPNGPAQVARKTDADWKALKKLKINPKW
ncbi:hypothetical protein MMC10_009456 [Thelotrema lepadinum]|nr:hypothetical protein [Thelotrema lepadinum]